MYISTCRSSKTVHVCVFLRIQIHFATSKTSTFSLCALTKQIYHHARFSSFCISVHSVHKKKTGLALQFARENIVLSFIIIFSAVRVHLKILEILALFKRYICDLTFTRSCNIPPRFYRFSSFHVEFPYYLSQSKFKIRFLQSLQKSYYVFFHYYFMKHHVNQSGFLNQHSKTIPLLL